MAFQFELMGLGDAGERALERLVVEVDFPPATAADEVVMVALEAVGEFDHAVGEFVQHAVIAEEAQGAVNGNPVKSGVGKFCPNRGRAAAAEAMKSQHDRVTRGGAAVVEIGEVLMKPVDDQLIHA
jgi:hypothetical protein